MVELTPDEARQVEEIALWKSERPSFLLAGFRGLSRPLTRLFTKVVRPEVVTRALAAMERRAEEHDHHHRFLKDVGIPSLEELRALPLEESDRLAARVSARAEHLALLEGAVPALGGLAVPGVGGAATAFIDVPILLEASLTAIRRIGHCYGYRLLSDKARKYVMGILDLANAESPDDRVRESQELEGMVDPSATTSNGPLNVQRVTASVVDDLPLEAVPIVGELSSIFLDYAFVHRVDVTARRVFQERWLRDKEKVVTIAPSPISRRRSSMGGLLDVGGELAYTTGLAVGFTVTLPAVAATRVAARLPLGPAKAGLHDGAVAAVQDASRLSDEFQQGLKAGLRPPYDPAESVVPATS
jgi:hypothetical protein